MATWPVVQEANQLYAGVIGPFFQRLATNLALYMPTSSADFIVAFCKGTDYQGAVAGSAAKFDEAGAAFYMKTLCGPVLEELIEIAIKSSVRNEQQLRDCVAAAAPGIAAKVDRAAARITSGVKGLAARKRVVKMKADPDVQARLAHARSNTHYSLTEPTPKQRRKQQAAAGGGVPVTHGSTAGRGVEASVVVDATEFEAYIQEQKLIAEARAAEAAAKAVEEAAAAEAAAAAAAAEAAAAAAAAPPAAEEAAPPAADAEAASAEAVAASEAEAPAAEAAPAEAAAEPAPAAE